VTISGVPQAHLKCFYIIQGNDLLMVIMTIRITMCSVLQSPIPWAPLFLALSASSGVSAFAMTYYTIIILSHKIDSSLTNNDRCEPSLS